MLNVIDSRLILALLIHTHTYPHIHIDKRSHFRIRVLFEFFPHESFLATLTRWTSNQASKLGSTLRTPATRWRFIDDCVLLLTPFGEVRKDDDVSLLHTHTPIYMRSQRIRSVQVVMRDDLG